MSSLKTYSIWPWLCVTFFTAALAFSFSSYREIESRYAQFVMVERVGLTTWGAADGINPETHKAKLESAYENISGEIKLFAALAVVALVVALILHVMHNRRIRRSG